MSRVFAMQVGKGDLDTTEVLFCCGDEEKRFVEERPHGEWIWKKDEDALRTYDFLCSECGYKTITCKNYDNVEQAKRVVDDRIREGKTLFSFCPNCGADMREGEARDE